MGAQALINPNASLQKGYAGSLDDKPFDQFTFFFWTRET